MSTPRRSIRRVPNNVTDAAGAGTAGFARSPRRINLLGQIAAGLAWWIRLPGQRGLRLDRHRLDLDTAKGDALMAGDHLDMPRTRLLASPVGQALIGKMAGDIVVVETPHRKRRLELRSVIALGEMIGVPDA